MNWPTVVACAAFFFLLEHGANAQCYPASSASWCFRSLDNSDIVNTRMIMGVDPDTVILGQTYQRIGEYDDALGWETWRFVRNYYVRSDSTGKGYIMLLDSMQEYLTADVSANVGDTVENVLTASSWGPWQGYMFRAVIVDSIGTFSNNGVTVLRRFVHALQFEPSYPTSHEIFWQQGMGHSYGPFLFLTVSGNFQELECIREQDIYVYSNETVYPGLPGIPCNCPLESPLAVEDISRTTGILARPNPSTGIFILVARMRGAVLYDALGQRLFATSSSRIDLSGYPPGVYTALVLGEHGSYAVRLVVER